jgi:glyoxylate reductase
MMAMAPDVFVTRPLPSPGPQPLLDAGLTVVGYERDESPPRDHLLEAVGGCRAVLPLLTERIDAELLDAAGPQLRVVANLAVGYDNIDLAAAAERGVVITNTPGVLTEATADLAWALLLAAARRVGEAERMVRRGDWSGWSPTQLVGAAVHGGTLGIVGMGAIGTAVARRGRGFGMQILYTNRKRRPDAEAEVGATFVPLDELLARSDVVSLNAPATADTFHLVDAVALERMKPTAILVNTARGSLVDEVALADALRAGTVGAAGLDVFEAEPTITPALLELDNVVLLPHLGSATTETRAAMVELACANIVAVLAGQPALTPVG